MHSKPLFIILWLWLLVTATPAQAPFTLTAASLQNGQAVELDKLGWKYSPGDEPRFADPQFDDRAWETLHGTAITLNNIPKSGWHGIGWFRLRLQADPALANQPLALVMVHYGASEIYLDGKLIERFGIVGATDETEVAYNPNTLPCDIVLDGRSEHVIAVRHSCQAMRNLDAGWGRWFAKQSIRPALNAITNGTIGYGAGFGSQLVKAKQAMLNREDLRSVSGYALLRMGLFLTIGLMHLLLYWFYPRQRANLFFGLFACVAASFSLVTVLFTSFHQNITWVLVSFVAWLFAFSFAPAFLLGFIYSAFSLRPSRWFWWWFTIVLLDIPFELLFPRTAPGRVLYVAITLFPIIEVIRVISQLVRMKIDKVGLISAAILAYILVNLFVTAARGGSIPGLSFVSRSLTISSFLLTFSFSAFLSRQFALTSRDLESQLVQVEQLSNDKIEQERREAELRVQHEKEKSENERRAKELEEARQLQLSMLPKKLPSLPHLDLAAYMKTASEVGGDYYDFHVGEDGTLTIAVGDATGHGLKAGTLVSSVKSLFVSLAYHPDIPHIFHRISAVLKEMKLRGLFMAMTMVKVQGHQMSVSIAGMPSVLIYRAASGEVEEVVMRALPLGGMTNYQYQQQELSLAANDIVVLMSDGLPERFNAQGEMLEEEAAKHFLTQHASGSAQQLIKGLAKLGDDWGGMRPQDDDVTFVVLKMI